jgi:hypothetical protein
MPKIKNLNHEEHEEVQPQIPKPQCQINFKYQLFKTFAHWSLHPKGTSSG